MATWGVSEFARCRWTRLKICLICVTFLVHDDLWVLGSIHEFHDQITGFEVTEQMFADYNGPLGNTGRSVLSISANLRALEGIEVSHNITIRGLSDYFDFGVALATYSADAAMVAKFDDHTACSWNFSNASNEKGKLEVDFYPMKSDQVLQVNATFYPTEGGLQTALLVPCWKQKSAAFGYPVSAETFVAYRMLDPLLFADVKIAFKNPYGYLPGLLYGLFPFNGVLSLMYGVLDIFFFVFVYINRQSVVGTHCFLIVVLVLATGESVTWFVTYKMLNESGVPVCCPYSGLVLISTLIKVLVGMVARIATTLVSLGYGIIRMQISWPEMFVVSGLGVCYFIAVGALEISHIANQSDGIVRPPAVWEALVITTNTCFGGWIFLSLKLTRNNLAAFGQTAKLQVYTSLHQILATYVVISFILMAIEGAVYSGAMQLPWTMIWIVRAATRLLFFCTLLVVIYLWRPTKHGLLYAQMDQIPSREPVTPASITRSIAQRVSSATDDDETKKSLSAKTFSTEKNNAKQVDTAGEE